MDRRFVGPCRDPEDLTRVLDVFRAHRDALDARLTELPDLRDRKRRLTERFLEGFWSVLDDDQRMQRAFVERCG